MSQGFISNIVGFLNKNSDYSVSDVTGALDNISDDIYHKGQSANSIFNLEEDTQMSYEDFLELMSDAAQMDVSTLNDKEMQMLFNILNTSGDDNVLSYDELKILAKGNEITDFSMWCAIACITDEEVKEASKTSSDDDDSDDTSVGGSNSSNTSTDWTPVKNDDGTYDLSDPATAQYWIAELKRKDGEETPKDVADRLLAEGEITQEEYDQIKSAYRDLTDKQIEEVQDLMARQGISMEEAIEKLGYGDNSDFDKPFPMDDSEIKKYANALYDAMRGAGTDEKALKNILDSDKISDDDFVLIMQEYLGMSADGTAKGSLIQHLCDDLSWASSGLTEEDAMKLVGERLLNAANDGNEDAINIICLELMNSTSGMDNGTAEDFVNYIFENASPEMLAKINERYPEINGGETLTEAIKGDFSWASGIFTSAHSQNWYLDKIKEANGY